MSSTHLLGLEISRSDLPSAVEACSQLLASGRGGYVCFVNVHTLSDSTRHTELRAALEGATIRYADGMPLVWLSHLKREPIAQRVSGPDLMAAMLGAHHDSIHGFLGGMPGRAEMIAASFGVRGIFHSPPVREFSPEHAHEDWQTFVACCPGGKPPAIVWVGLGAPKQELWLAAVSPHARSTVFFGVGAAFDFLSGAKRRAPRWMQRTGLEWAYRLGSDPRRLWKRYIVTNTRFMLQCVRELSGSRRP
jgi:N-acetylglucosaminyldiphosphoundecaprenol N-acetyl-beta-D-mannosaminyltransferase